MLPLVFRSLASLKLGVVLIVLLAAVLAWATVLEADKGREYAQWYVYGSHWFSGLLAMLAVNILAATLVRFPWRKKQVGFVVTHAGLLVLLVGSIQTFVDGIEGRTSLREGGEANELLITDRSLITVVSPAKHGRTSTELSFRPGPVDWRDGNTLDFGQSEGFGLRVLKFYRHAREKVDWVTDDSEFGGPALKLALSGPDGKPISDDWLTAGPFGGEAIVGPMKFDLLPISSESMLEDFLDPPTDEMGDRGILSMHYEDRMVRVAVGDNVGKKVPVGETGLAVEIVEYLANAKPDAGGRFVSRGDEPKNPLLELKIHVPGRDHPMRQIAFARLPLLNLDGVHGWECPVKFWYHHSAVSPPPGAMFLQAPDGKLYCRAAVGGAWELRGEVKQGDRVETSGQFSVSIVKYLSHARQQVTLLPLAPGPGETAKPEAAALVEVTTDRATQQVWLKRNDPQYGLQRIPTHRGPLVLNFGYDHLPLEFSLKLLEFTRGLNPGRVGDASFASSVRLIDQTRGIDEERQISMNEPLAHGKFTFYQSSFQELPDGTEISILTAAYDPGRFLKYLGSLMICTGIFLMFYMRSYMFQNVPFFVFRSPSAAGVGSQSEDGGQRCSQTLKWPVKKRRPAAHLADSR